MRDIERDREMCVCVCLKAIILKAIILHGTQSQASNILDSTSRVHESVLLARSGQKLWPSFRPQKSRSQPMSSSENGGHK